VEVEAIFFDVPLEVCIARNAKRHRVVPVDVLAKMAGNLVAPTEEEGFARVTRVE
jgi:predicted kinase